MRARTAAAAAATRVLGHFLFLLDADLLPTAHIAATLSDAQDRGALPPVLAALPLAKSPAGALLLARDAFDGAVLDLIEAACSPAAAAGGGGGVCGSAAEGLEFLDAAFADYGEEAAWRGITERARWRVAAPGGSLLRAVEL